MSDAKFVLLDKILLPPISGSRPLGGVSSGSDGIPSVGGENIKSNGSMDYEGVRRITEAFYNNMPKGRLQRLDVLINKDGAQTGKVGIYDGAFDKAAVNEHVFILRGGRPDYIDQIYLFYCLLLPETQQKIYRRITGSAQPGLNSQFVRAVDVPIREIAKQKKIAHILQTVDRTIEHTEALINKYQQIKAGLTQDLFTRGIGSDGQLRPHRDQAPDLYQQTPIGWIPKKWTPLMLKEILHRSGGYIQTGPFGSQLHSHEYTYDGIPVVMPQDISAGKIDEIQIARITELRAQSLAKHRLRIGDIIIARRGELSRAAAIGETEQGWVCGTGCFLLRLGGAALNAHFFSMLYRNVMVQRQVDGLAVGSTMPSLNNEIMGKLIFPYMSIEEQTAISDKVQLIDDRLTSLDLEVEKLRKQKSGLMHDLLTGSVHAHGA